MKYMILLVDIAFVIDNPWVILPPLSNLICKEIISI